MTIDRKLDNQNKANAVFIEFAYAKLLAIEGSISVLHFPKEEQAAEFLTLEPLLNQVKQSEAKLLQVAEELKDI